MESSLVLFSAYRDRALREKNLSISHLKPMVDNNTILLSHGGGGIQSRELVRTVFETRFRNRALSAMGDSAIVEIPRSKLAFTTDAFVVRPLFFPGGDIGKLAVCGTVNDLAVAGARPLYLSAGFIIEEGLAFSVLERIAESMASAAREAGVVIVAGDTKVVERGKCDGIFVTTSGIGEVFVKQPMTPSRIEAGDWVIINGPIADHGMAIMTAREGLKIGAEIESDCAPLQTLAEGLCRAAPGIRFMRDATRGGLAAVLNEACEGQGFGIEIEEEAILVNDGTMAACELLGIDPLHVANEGKLVAVVPPGSQDAALAAMRSNTFGKRASVIGRVISDNKGRVVLKTQIGTRRIVAMPSGELLPRIC